jgi:hypothetical protein
MSEKTSVTALAAIMGILNVNKPNRSHKNVPKANREYMGNDKEEVSFVLIVLIAWGKKEIVVLTAAHKPMIVIVLNDFSC